MQDNKQDFDQLNHEELKDAKGGIPYEKPNLVELDGDVLTCKTGSHCESGGNDYCGTGRICDTGSHGPGIPPPK